MSIAPTADFARPGVLPWTLGNRVVVALNDGHLVATLGLVQGIPADEAGRLQEEGFRDTVAPRITVNAFLILGGDKPVLVDAGMGSGGPETLGHLPEALAACGVAPEDVGTVLVTHLHSDHIGGLIARDGAVAFPNAEVVIPEAEAAYWLAEGAEARAPEGARAGFRRAHALVAAYGDRIRRAGEGEVLPGIEAILAPGHTPGHTAYRVQSGDRSLLIWGDVVHLPAIQLPRPEVGLTFDVDREVAAATRKRILDQVAAERSLVAGMHLEFPALGYVRRAGAGFAWVPEQWSAAS
ncbi:MULTISPECIES: MBL fold metallo-hydrolase [Methylobacterium]|uniref:MBL fold metallo-hydrolase n=1 Tax=Methylobacterium TaxID=407 RepID=UPI0008F3D8E1|nr:MULTISPECIES: MBL fold metallo-hydrolase [Methylobacterium]MBZ6413154.1 MBL fold metallo-hydrolase [Methylobacterium sp.]SFF43961.1 Glyoxylase, beta-lactamase superfamily II [Methylobacterium sp. yr596]